MCFLAEYVWQQTSFSTWITTKQLYRLDCFFACKCSLALLYLSMQVWYRGPSILLCGWFFVPHLIPRPPTVSSYLCLANSNKLFLSGSIGCQEMEDIQIDVISALFWQLYPSFYTVENCQILEKHFEVNLVSVKKKVCNGQTVKERYAKLSRNFHSSPTPHQNKKTWFYS